MESLVQHISDTALWVAIFRADESERPDAIFVDPYARRLAGKRGEQIADSIEFSRKNSWSFVARTFLFDECIKKTAATLKRLSEELMDYAAMPEPQAQGAPSHGQVFAFLKI